MDQQRRSLYLLLFTLFQVLIGFGIIMPVKMVWAGRALRARQAGSATTVA